MNKKINVPRVGPLLQPMRFEDVKMAKVSFGGKTVEVPLPKISQEVIEAMESMDRENGYPTSPYDTRGLKFGSHKLSIRHDFIINLPDNLNMIQLEQGDNFSKAPLLIFNYNNTGRMKNYKFMWAGENETVDPDAIECYIGYCRIQGNIQHLLILK